MSSTIIQITLSLLLPLLAILLFNWYISLPYQPAYHYGHRIFEAEHRIYTKTQMIRMMALAKLQEQAARDQAEQSKSEQDSDSAEKSEGRSRAAAKASPLKFSVGAFEWVSTLLRFKGRGGGGRDGGHIKTSVD